MEAKLITENSIHYESELAQNIISLTSALLRHLINESDVAGKFTRLNNDHIRV
jgi:hypothetical protein